MRGPNDKLDLEESIYIAKYLDYDGVTMMAEALGVNVNNVINKARNMQKSGVWGLYKSITDEEYEKIVLAKDKRIIKEEERREKIWERNYFYSYQ